LWEIDNVSFDFNRYSALIHCPGSRDCFYAFHDPLEEVSGSFGEWDLLEEKLKSYHVSGWDLRHPPGAAVGAFSYEGDFRFRFYGAPEQVRAEDLFFAKTLQPVGVASSGVCWKSSHDLSAYVQMVEEAQEFIRRGDIYQVNLARQFDTEVVDWNSESFFKSLWHTTHAPYAAYLLFDDFEIYAASPELFLSIEGDRILTQPIKGTRPRGRDAMGDRQNALELATNSKEVAELVMITDLERNDLGRICEYGSVEVKELVRCRTYSHVFHLASTVTGRIQGGISPLRAVQACYPGGSITGAPKLKAMEMIRHLEHAPRGFYTGAFGYFGFDGSVQLGMSIRTCERRGDKLSFWAGSGITIDSDPVKEFEETHHKAAAMQGAYELYLNNRPALSLKKSHP
jgi:para-aminobenzoate synthetase component I